MTNGKSKKTALSLIRDTRGISTVEYLIILALVAIVGFGVWKNFGTTVKDKVTDADTAMKTLEVKAP
jgi:Flp pilus assembly pilin Flp